MRDSDAGGSVHQTELVWGSKANAANFEVAGCSRQVPVGRNPESGGTFTGTNAYEHPLSI